MRCPRNVPSPMYSGCSANTASLSLTTHALDKIPGVISLAYFKLKHNWAHDGLFQVAARGFSRKEFKFGDPSKNKAGILSAPSEETIFRLACLLCSMAMLS